MNVSIPTSHLFLCLHPPSSFLHPQATVRCSSKMVVRVILPDQLEDYLNQNPLARNQVWNQGGVDSGFAVQTIS